MKKVFVLVLVLTVVFGTIAASALPPGQANREMNRNQEEFYGPFGMLPPGLVGKFIPPGLAKKGLDLPPGLADRADEDLPPGILMRFRQAVQWNGELNPAIPDQRLTAESYDELLAILDNDDYKDQNLTIRLLEDIELDAPLVITGERWVRINGEGNVLTVDEDRFDEKDWMIFVEDGAHLMLYNVELDGFLEDNDVLKGLVFVEEGGKLSASNSDFRNAVDAFGFEMDISDYEDIEDEDYEEFLDEHLSDNNNKFPNIEFYVTIYNVEDLDEILFDLEVE